MSEHKRHETTSHVMNLIRLASVIPAAVLWQRKMVAGVLVLEVDWADTAEGTQRPTDTSGNKSQLNQRSGNFRYNTNNVKYDLT